MRSALRLFAAPLALAGSLGALFCAGPAHAQVFVTPTVTFNGSLYHYNYSVVNATADSLALIDLNGLPMVAGALTNFSAPDGYQITNPYDFNVGIESFLPGLDNNTAFGPGSTVSGFSFDSIFAPSAIAFDTTGDPGTPAGTTLGPAGAPVPEASTVVSLGLGLSVLALLAVRRRRAASIVHTHA